MAQVTDDWTHTEQELFGLANWGNRVEDEKAVHDDPYVAPRDMLQLNKKDVYEAMDVRNRWWAVTLLDYNDDGTYKASVHDGTGQQKTWDTTLRAHVRRILPTVQSEQASDSRFERRKCDKCGGTGKVARFPILWSGGCTGCNGTGFAPLTERFQQFENVEHRRSTGHWVPATIDRVYNERNNERYVISYQVDGKPSTKSIYFQEAEDCLRPSIPRCTQFEGRRLTDFTLQEALCSMLGGAPRDEIAVRRATAIWQALPTVAIHILPNVETAPNGPLIAHKFSTIRRVCDGTLMGRHCNHILAVFGDFEDYPEYLPRDLGPVMTPNPVTRCIITEDLSPGMTLAAALRELRRTAADSEIEGEPLPPLNDRQVWVLLKQLTTACLHWTRAGLCHRQVTPDNIFISSRVQRQDAYGQSTWVAQKQLPSNALLRQADFRLVVTGFEHAVMCSSPRPQKQDRARAPGAGSPTPMVAACRAASLQVPELRAVPPEVLRAHLVSATDEGATADFSCNDTFGIGLVLYDCLCPTEGADPWGRDPETAVNVHNTVHNLTDDSYVDLPTPVGWSSPIRALVRQLLRLRLEDRMSPYDLTTKVHGQDARART
eukprot:TRINITY_DN6356_c0_g1_i1.p1 TRINITY_DN6356_c0_g1~~TRINITY_DN6356_c0_g1_i1.p1  ORF type:complete len:602 (+),score=100.25 TRINITY_DN6356_c0_g1_i1:120-1925(+)